MTPRSTPGHGGRWPVITVRCTGKLLKVLKPGKGTLAEVEASPEDWYANLVWLSARKCVLLTHAGTLFSVFLPDVRAANLRPFGAAWVPALRAALALEGLPEDAFGPMHAMQLAKTADRRVLGTMRELAVECEEAVAKAGGLAGLDLLTLHHDLQRVPNGTRGYARAIDLVRQRVS